MRYITYVGKQIYINDHTNATERPSLYSGTMTIIRQHHRKLECVRLQVLKVRFAAKLCKDELRYSAATQDSATELDLY